MKFETAEKELKKRANGEYHRIAFQKTVYGDGTVKNEVTLYIDDSDIIHAQTFQEAFNKLDGLPQKQEDQPPEGEL